MAVVFISPKKQQKMFFIWITTIVGIFVVSVSLVVLLSGPKEVSQELVFNKPKVSINFAVLDTNQFTDLEPFVKMALQFSYTATTKKEKRISGFITAESLEQAKEIIEGMGLTQINVKEVENGRENPFMPYYETLPATKK